MQRTLIWQLAYRYLRGRGQANAVPILSRISMGAIAVSSAAMIILFSVFNGLEDVVKNMYKTFYPDIKISVKRGKFFPSSVIKLETIAQLPGVLHVAPVIEDNVLVEDGDAIGGSANRQKVVIVKGIDNNYFNVNELRDSISGVDSVSIGKVNTTILGIHIAHELGADRNNDFSFIKLHYPNASVTNPENDPLNAFQSVRLHPCGTFAVSDEFDDKYILAPISLIQELFKAQGKYSSIELKTNPSSTIEIQSTLKKMLGADYNVETQFEQNKTIYMVMAGEKWAMYLLLMFVMVIASFNMIGALTMLVMEKRKDIAILRAMGADRSAITGLFMLEGTMWACTGGVIGLSLGCLICFLQQQFKLIKLQSSSLYDSFPVKFYFPDILLVMGSIVVIGIVFSFYPAIKAGNTEETGLKSN